MGKGDAGSQDAPAEVVPVGGAAMGSTKRRFGNIIDAISQIQQFAVIEQDGTEIPEDFLTVRGRLNFFNIGFGHGFIEGLMFALLMAVIMPFLYDASLVRDVAKYFPLIQFKSFLWGLNLLPVIVVGGMCCFLSKYRIGIITKKAIDALLIGRLFCLIMKGILIFVVLIFLSNRITAGNAWKAANAVTLWNRRYALMVYQAIWDIKPHLVTTAYDVLAIFIAAMLMPFLTVWLVAFYRWAFVTKERRFWDV